MSVWCILLVKYREQRENHTTPSTYGPLVSPLDHIRRRVPWRPSKLVVTAVCPVLSGLACCTISFHFEETPLIIRCSRDKSLSYPNRSMKPAKNQPTHPMLNALITLLSPLDHTRTVPSSPTVTNWS